MQKNAIDGDKVIVKLLSQTEEGSDGKIVSIVKAVEKIAGVVCKVGNNFL